MAVRPASAIQVRFAEPVSDIIEREGIIAAAVISGNRNFEGRISPHTRANYLASPPLVAAFALAGKVDIDFSTEPIGATPEGRPVFLKEIWPSSKEIGDLIRSVIRPELFLNSYAHIGDGNRAWNDIKTGDEPLYNWDKSSTYLLRPPFFDARSRSNLSDSIRGARVLLLLGNSVTTDHISPAGDIPEYSPAGEYLLNHKVLLKDFNSYGSRRGNHEVMSRGTFANIRIKNKIAAGVEGGVTRCFPDGELMQIHEAVQRYRAEATPLIVIAGKNYGTGSSRDWAAKGPYLLGVKAILAESFERIHRSNLVGMGVLPLEFLPGENAASLNLDGTELYSIENIYPLSPGKHIPIIAMKNQSAVIRFNTVLRINTPIEVHYLNDGGIMQTILLGLAKSEM